MISPKALEEFKQIWKEQRGEDLSDELAIEHAINLLNTVDIVYRPIKEESEYLPTPEINK